MTQRVAERREIAIEHTWNTESVYATDLEWEADVLVVAEELPALTAFRGTLGSSAANLADWFDALHPFVSRVRRVSLYAGMLHAVDTAEPIAAARYGRAQTLFSRTMAALAFGEPELLAIDTRTLAGWLTEEPRLAHYRHYFDRLERRRLHVRSAEVEGLLGQVWDSFSAGRSIHSTLVNTDLTFTPATDSFDVAVEIAQGNIGLLLTDPDREMRRTAWERYADSFLAMQNTMAGCLSAGVKQDVFVARARGYASSLEAALEPANVPVSVFHNLIAVFKANLPTWHRYWEIRRAALGLEALHVYDVKAPLTRNSPVVPYAQAVEWIAEGMEPLGTEYVQALRRGATTERWVDIYPNKGKRMGAYSSGMPGTHPFILMSYNDDIFSLSTLAHELGHSMHSYLSWQTQPPVYSSYGLFVAEVASNFNQALVRDHLLRSNPDTDFQIAVIEEAMSNFHRYFFVMPTLARFELEIHERVERGEALTATSLNFLMADLFKEGFGERVVVDEARVGSTWAQFPTHLYSNFYVYQYATGISGAHALAQGVVQEGAPAAARYLNFLRAGGSLYPLDNLRAAGVDLESPAPVERAFKAFAGYVDRLENLLSI